MATSSDQALSALSRSCFDLVISDMERDHVPDEGLRFLARMRSGIMSVPIIFTGHRLTVDIQSDEVTQASLPSYRIKDGSGLLLELARRVSRDSVK